MKIESGKYYKSRDGQKVGPMYSFSNHAKSGVLYADVNGAARAFYIDGGKRKFMGNVGDLIAEWIDDPVTGTLRELNVHVGDVIKLVSGSQDGWADGNCYTIKPDGRVLNNDGSGQYWGNISDQDDDLGIKFRIISRASSPSPVITETVTTQRIVPGVYGRVSIAGSSQTSVELEFVGEYGPTGRSRLSQAELTSAITTLTQIRDAIAHNSSK